MKTKPWILIIAVVGLAGLIAIVAVATSAFSREIDEPMNTLTTGKTIQPVAIPPMDADAPVKTETATFALG